MDCFFVDGASKSFADIILQQRIDGKKCQVASYGFGVLQIRKIINAFDSVSLVADISHAQLNAEVYDIVVDMSRVLPNFSFVATKTHAKLALIDDKTIIFTSANLSANRRMESYLIGSFDEISGVENIKEIFSRTTLAVENLEREPSCKGDFKIIEAGYLDPGGLNEPRYTHTVED